MKRLASLSRVSIRVTEGLGQMPVSSRVAFAAPTVLIPRMVFIAIWRRLEGLP